MTWQVVRTPRFNQDVAGHLRQAPRLQEAVAGAARALERLADQAPPAPGTPFYGWPIHMGDGLSFLVYFTRDEEQVVLHALRPTVAPHAPAHSPTD